MSETRFKFKKCELLPNEGSSLDEKYGVISRKGIFGGEYIDLTVEVDGYDDFKLTQKKHNLMLNSVRNVITETNKQVATLEFVSVESIINETARVNKKFTGNVSQTVSELLVSYKKGIQTKKKLDKHDGDIVFSKHGSNYPTDGKFYEQRVVNINKGDMVLFPSSIFHGTVPFESKEQRITLAFDIIPIE